MKIEYEHAFEYFFNLIKNKNCHLPFVIAFDGRSCSGKTTLAERLRHELDIPVIHTDEFFRPKDKNGNLIMTAYDGNFDLMRFKCEVVDSIKQQRSFMYGVFDCNLGKIEDYKEIPVSNCYIIEGAYSLNPNLGEYVDFRAFFDVQPNLQRERIINRNGVHGYEKFKKIWLPAEERYFEHYKIYFNCDIVVEE